MEGSGTRVIRNDDLELAVATSFGPRVVSLTPSGGPNLLAELGDLGIDLDDGRRFLFHGGHRLWVAPEIPDVTYEPDEGEVVWSESEATMSVSGTIGAIEKTIAVRLDGWVVKVDHRITNLAEHAIELAPWAITQLPPGGTALLPLQRDATDARGLQASHALVGWPYTDWGSLGYDADSGVILIEGNRTTPTKLGTSVGRGWLAYVQDGWVFAKYARPDSAATVDRGAQAQVYANASFVEVETLGGVARLETGESTSHREVWRVMRAPGSITDVPGLVEQAQEGE